MNEKCPECDGERCPFCLNTGKKLYRIGEEVILDNQDGNRGSDYSKHVGKKYRVTGLLRITGDSDRYYVGIDAPIKVTGNSEAGIMVFDTNLRRVSMGRV